ncbi:hypothetical protein PMV43_03305 [Enterococcus casseliflavus]|jgi:hypothetical protein|nr:hypothetical protein [Enterococcus casseliflavus]
MMPWKKIDSQNGSIGYPWLFLRFSKNQTMKKGENQLIFSLH